MCKTVESVMNLSAPHLLLPLHFRESVVLYSLTGSKIALALMASGGSNGSYKQVKKFLYYLGTDSKLNLVGDVIFVFDNNQILHRQWSVKVDSKFQCHIITMVVVFEINKYGKLQIDIKNKPIQWMQENNAITKSLRCIDQEPDVKNIHYNKHLYPFLTYIITTVAQEQKTNHSDETEKSFSDQIDIKVEQNQYQALYKDCFNKDCGQKNIQKAKLNCPTCKQNLKQYRLEATSGVTDHHSTYEAPVVMKSAQSTSHPRAFRLELKKKDGTYSMSKSEIPIEETELHVDPVHFQVSTPVFVNPCSYDTCLDILRDIGRKAGIKKYKTGDREWVSVCCDGSPYVLCLRLILSTYLCDTCGVSVMGIPAIDQHLQNHSADNSTPNIYP